MNRHDRKELLHGPTVGHALKQREVAEVSIGQQAVEPFELFRKKVELLRQPQNLAADRPVEIFRQAALCERKIAEAEQIQRRIKRLLRIVKALEQILLGERRDAFRTDRSGAARHLRADRRQLFFAESADAQHVEHERL